MKNWLINLLVGYNFKEEIDNLKEERKYYKSKYDKSLEDNNKLKKDYECELSELSSLRVKYHKLDMDNFDKKKRIDGFIIEIDKLEKELCNEQRKVDSNLRSIEELLLRNEKLYKRGIELKEEVSKLKKINQEMTAKKSSKFTTKQIVELLSIKPGVETVNVGPYERGDVKVEGPMKVLKVVD